MKNKKKKGEKPVYKGVEENFTAEKAQPTPAEEETKVASPNAEARLRTSANRFILKRT